MFNRQRARGLCVRALLYRYFGGEGEGFEYRPSGLLLSSVAFKEFTE